MSSYLFRCAPILLLSFFSGSSRSVLLVWPCWPACNRDGGQLWYAFSTLSIQIVILRCHAAYYRYLNAHGKSTASTVFLIVGLCFILASPLTLIEMAIVAILDAGRNSMSFFMLLVVSLGLSVVKESLGRTMLKCQGLAVAHFIFGSKHSLECPDF